MMTDGERPRGWERSNCHMHLENSRFIIKRRDRLEDRE
ncbi:hypothetical protein AGRO_0936 [Agrobacterium sp. ATCC 31749]|nr:hypothetical protein AGRO_0936 [Agrobacterium sp. ATCC 31749]